MVIEQRVAVGAGATICVGDIVPQAKLVSFSDGIAMEMEWIGPFHSTVILCGFGSNLSEERGDPILVLICVAVPGDLGSVALI